MDEVTGQGAGGCHQSLSPTGILCLFNSVSTSNLQVFRQQIEFSLKSASVRMWGLLASDLNFYERATACLGVSAASALSEPGAAAADLCLAAVLLTNW